MTSVFALLLGLLMLGCAKEPPVEDQFQASESYNRSIKAEVSHRYSIVPAADSLVAGATVLLYTDRDQFIYNGTPSAWRITDSMGKATFEFLNGSYYWVRTLHPDLGEQLDSVSTPENTISFLLVTFL